MAQGVNQLKDITVVWYSSVASTLSVYTDMPGGALAVRQQITIPVASGTGRNKQTWPLDVNGEIDGKLLKLKVTANSASGYIQLFEISIRHREIGLYLDGTQNDFWETQPISLGG